MGKYGARPTNIAKGIRGRATSFNLRGAAAYNRAWGVGILSTTNVGPFTGFNGYNRPPTIRGLIRNGVAHRVNARAVRNVGGIMRQRESLHKQSMAASRKAGRIITIRNGPQKIAAIGRGFRGGVPKAAFAGAVTLGVTTGSLQLHAKYKRSKNPRMKKIHIKNKAKHKAARAKYVKNTTRGQRAGRFGRNMRIAFGPKQKTKSQLNNGRNQKKPSFARRHIRVRRDSKGQFAGSY